jgi:hypothetical protein
VGKSYFIKTAEKWNLAADTAPGKRCKILPAPAARALSLIFRALSAPALRPDFRTKPRPALLQSGFCSNRARRWEYQSILSKVNDPPTESGSDRR